MLSYVAVYQNAPGGDGIRRVRLSLVHAGVDRLVVGSDGIPERIFDYHRRVAPYAQFQVEYLASRMLIGLLSFWV